MKTIEAQFADWEAGVFGYGYGTGEPHVLTALQIFLREMDPSGCYQYEKQEAACTPAVAWLLINTLCHADIIEYGTSPRFGWLTPQGMALKDFVCSRPVNVLDEAIAENDDSRCYRDYCNCDEGDCRPSNPFWNRTALPQDAGQEEKR